MPEMTLSVRRTVAILLPCAALFAYASAEERDKLSTDCEIAIALSAAPQRLRSDASVYKLQAENYKKVVEGAGPLTCIVERNHRDSIIPQCLDRAGVDSILPAIISRSLMSVSGASISEINEVNATKLSNGDYAAASRPGISYMMSDFNYIFIESADHVRKVPPHVMFYAPGIANADIGGSFESMSNNIGTPYVFNEGPHGYMVVYTQYPANPDEVAGKCRGQLGEAPPLFNPFPKG